MGIDPYNVDRKPDDGAHRPSIVARVGRYLSGMEVAWTYRGDGEVLATRAPALLEEVHRLEKENAHLREWGADNANRRTLLNAADALQEEESVSAAWGAAWIRRLADDLYPLRTDEVSS